MLHLSVPVCFCPGNTQYSGLRPQDIDQDFESLCSHRPLRLVDSINPPAPFITSSRRPGGAHCPTVRPRFASLFRHLSTLLPCSQHLVNLPRATLRTEPANHRVQHSLFRLYMAVFVKVRFSGPRILFTRMALGDCRTIFLITR